MQRLTSFGKLFILGTPKGGSIVITRDYVSLKKYPRPLFPRPSDKKPPRPRYNRPCPVHHSSVLPTTTQPRQKCSTTIFHPFNNHVPTTSQPSFGSNTRTTRFRLNLPTSLIRQLQPILKNNSTSTKKLAQDRPFRVLCRRSAARHPRKDRAAASRW